jgi:adenylyl-sulfate kinase
LGMENPIIYPRTNTISQEARSEIKGHKPLVIWMTGFSGSGKSTIANELERILNTRYKAHTYLLDGDNIRNGLNFGLGFSDEDRSENIRRIGEVSKLMVDAGLIVITAFISPFQKDRDKVRALVPQKTFWEVYVSTPLEVCMARDPKGLYRMAGKGEVSRFTGISSPYEPPNSPEITIDTVKLSVAESVDLLIQHLLNAKIINEPVGEA